MRKLPAYEVRRPHKVRSPADAVRFIDAVGFCMLFPVKNVPLPSLYYACAQRDIRLGPQWDKYCQMIWEWKDQLPRRRRAFYAKYLQMRGTFISLKLLPHFLAANGSPTTAADHERFYAAGRISHDAATVWAALAQHGPLATLELRHACKMDSKGGNQRFKRAMLGLQGLLAVVHFGTEQETAAWASSRFELTCRVFPRQVAAARKLAAAAARRAIAAKYLRWFPDASPAQIARLFGWSRQETVAACPPGRAREC
jgi:hypothetical protein